jgi:wyosine [tRNA(Phe)-imidazoG37] synthetase (radical SAM superfamily)
MSVLELQKGIVYGPVNSRRLGRSLGINLLPPRRKLCTFDCVYCQYGSAAPLSSRPLPSGLPSVSAVVREVEEAIGRQESPPDYLTFSGNGEPTLHPDFPEIVDEILLLRDRACPEARVAILSNSSQAHRPEIRKAIELLDDPIMKLDAGDAATLSLISRPASVVTFEKIIEGLAEMPLLIIQTMIISGQPQNAEGEAHEAWLTALARLSPDEVQIYTAERPVPESGVQQVSKEVLEGLARQAQERLGVPVRAY